MRALRALPGGCLDARTVNRIHRQVLSVLVVTRKKGQSIVVGDGIEIHVISVGRHGARIGVSAPREVTVHRREVYDMVVAANRSAASSDVQAVSALASVLRSRASAAASPARQVDDAPCQLA